VPVVEHRVGSCFISPNSYVSDFTSQPGNDIPGTRGDGICWIKIGSQKCRIQVALHRPDAARALVQPL